MQTEDTLILDDLLIDDINFDDLGLEDEPELDALIASHGFTRLMAMATAEVAAAAAAAKRRATATSSSAAKRTCIRIPTSILNGYKDWAGQHCVGYQTLMIRDLRSAMAARQAAKTPPISKP